ncbi:MAG: hypothetical protein K6F57_03320 [Candidatus Saccharibacteria bacterium]|nr:hypothetical protein [Candidatus Saccharibacteria bacterium]
MRSNRKALFILTIILAIVFVIGFIMVLLSPKTLTDSAYDVVILLISGVSIAVAIYSEVGLNREARRVEKVVHELNEMRKNVDNDMAIDKNVRYKLDKIIALDEQIYKKVGGRKKTNDLVKDAKDANAKPAKS